MVDVGAALQGHMIGEQLQRDVEEQRIELAHGLPSGPGALFVRPHDLVLAEPAGGNRLSATIVSLRRRGPVRRVELLFGDGLPTVEIEVPLESCVRRGQRVPLRLVTPRLFAA